MATPTLISATPRINSITGDTIYTYTYSDGSVYTANASNPTAIFQTYAPGGIKNSLTNRVMVSTLPDGNIPNPAGADANYVQTPEQKTATEQAAQQAAADLAAQQAAQQAAADLAAQQAAQQPVAPVAPVAPPAPTVVSSGSTRINDVWGQQVQLSDGSVTFYPGVTLPFSAGTSATTLPTNGTVITSAAQAAATQAQQLADQQAQQLAQQTAIAESQAQAQQAAQQYATTVSGMETAGVQNAAQTTAEIQAQQQLQAQQDAAQAALVAQQQQEAQRVAAENAAREQQLQQEAATRVTDVNAQIDAQQKAQAEQDAAMAAKVAQAEQEALQLKYKNTAAEINKAEFGPAYAKDLGLADYPAQYITNGLRTWAIGPAAVESFDPSTAVTKISTPIYDVSNQVTWYPTASGWQQKSNPSLTGYNTNISMQLPEISNFTSPIISPNGTLYFPQTGAYGGGTGWYQGSNPDAPGYTKNAEAVFYSQQQASAGLPVNRPTTGPYSDNYTPPGAWDWYDPVAAGAFTSQAAVERYMQNKANESFGFGDIGDLFANFDKTINQTVGWDGLAALAIGGWLGPAAGALTSVVGGIAAGKDTKAVLLQAAITYAASYGLEALNDSLASMAQSATESAVSEGIISPEEGANIADEYINNAVDIGDTAAADAGYNNAGDYYDAVDSGYTDSSSYYSDYPAGTSGPEIPGATEVTPTGSVTNPDGSITTTYDNGSSITINTDGTVTTGGTVPTSTTPVSPDTTWSDIQGAEYAGPANPDYIKTGTGTVTVEPTADYYNSQGIPQIEVTGAGGYEVTPPVNVTVTPNDTGSLMDAISNLTPAQIAAAGGVAALLAGGAAAIAAAGGGGGAAAGAAGSTAATTGTTTTGAVAPTGGATAAPVEPTAPTTGGATGGTTTPPPTEPTTGPVSPETTGGAATGAAGGTATTGGTTGATTGTTTGEVTGTTGTTGGTGGTTTGGTAGTGSTTGPVSPEGTTGTTTGTTTTGGVQPEQPPAPVSSTTTGAPGETVTNPAGETTTTPLPPAEQPPAPVTESGPPQTIKTVADAQAAGIDASTIAKWLAAGLIVSALGQTVPVQPNWSSFYAGQSPWAWGTGIPVNTTGGGINPGLLMGKVGPYYQNAAPGQNAYFWGQHPTVTSTQNINQQWNNTPYAPVQPFGQATSAVGGTQHLNVPQFIQQTIGTPQYQAAAQGSAQYIPIAPSTAVVGGPV